MRRFLYDTAVFLYAVGSDHPLREPCREIVALARHGELAGEASVEVIQEFAHVRMRRGGDRQEALTLTRAVADLCELHDFDRRDLPLVMTLLEQHEALGVRDAVHAATALGAGIDAILSPDTDFDAVPGLDRIDPLDHGALGRLAARAGT